MTAVVRIDTTHTWHGTGASPGVAEGSAHVIDEEADLASMVDATVVVVRHATPALLPHVLRASAVICETGGLLNHLAILARELRKPCVTSLAGVTGLVRSGDRVRVDGTNGVVEILDTGSRPATPGCVRMEPIRGMVPVFQFGQFSGAFELVQPLFNAETAVQVAALVALPEALEVSPPWHFAVDQNRVLIDEQELSQVTCTLTDRVASGGLPADALHDLYEASSCWNGWQALRAGRAAESFVRQGLGCFVQLCQLTWLAILVKEPVCRRYRDFVVARLADLPEEERQRLFLDSLITLDTSYIRQVWLEPSQAGERWSLPGIVEQVGSDFAMAVRRIRALDDAALCSRTSALEQLARHLPQQDTASSARLVSALFDLIDLAERKNTDLHRCGRDLFGNAENQALIAGLCGTVMVEAGFEPGTLDQQVRRVLDALRDGSLPPGLRPITVGNSRDPG